MKNREQLYTAGLRRAEAFCDINRILMPAVHRLRPSDRLFHLATCAFYRPDRGISIMVEKCASYGYGGRAWSWPGYAIDRTPYGVIQHELGHHVDDVKSEPAKSRDDVTSLFSWKIYQQSAEEPLTGYLGTDTRAPTFFAEWLAEIFRLFVTNPDLCRRLRPRFFNAMHIAGVGAIDDVDWKTVLVYRHNAPLRTVEQARKKIAAVESAKPKQMEAL